MNLRIILSLVVTLLIAVSSYAAIGIDDGLVLKGEFSQTSSRSVTPSLPMTADLAENVLLIEFSAAVGDVNIAVSGMSGVVYSSSVKVTTIGQGVSISLDGLESGVYLLEFKNSKGGYVFAEFVVD